jgi:hypothetical protein
VNYRKTLIKIVTFLGGIYFFLEFVLPEKIGGVSINAYHDQISLGFVAVGVMALGLGLINLLAVHGSKLLFKKKGWLYSAALLGGLFSMTIIMIFDWARSAENASYTEKVLNLRDFTNVIVSDAASNKEGVPPKEVRTEALVGAVKEVLLEVEASLLQVEDLKLHSAEVYKKSRPAVKSTRETIVAIHHLLEGAQDRSDVWYTTMATTLGELAASWGDLLNMEYEVSAPKQWYDLLYEGLFFPLGAAMFSLLGFYIAAAAYRAFRVRSAESALMMLAAVIVMLGQIPFGIWIWEELPEVRSWLLSVPSTAAFRAIEIGASVGGLVMAFRMWLSIESESFSKGKER